MGAHVVGTLLLSGSGAGTDNVSIVTDAPVPANKRLLMGLAYFSDNNDATLSAVISDLTWTVDRSHINASRTNKRTSVASAYCASGLAAGSNLQLWWDHPDVWAMAKVYWLDELPANSFPNGGASGASALDTDLPWSLGTIGVTQPSVTVGTVWTDFIETTSSPTNGNLEAWEYTDPGFRWCLATNYKEVSADNAVSGVWAAAGQGWQGTSVSYTMATISGRDVLMGDSDVLVGGMNVLTGADSVFYGPEDIL